MSDKTMLEQAREYVSGGLRDSDAGTWREMEAFEVAQVAAGFATKVTEDLTAKVEEREREIERLKDALHNAINICDNIGCGSIIYHVGDVQRIARQALNPVQTEQEKP